MKQLRKDILQVLKDERARRKILVDNAKGKGKLYSDNMADLLLIQSFIEKLESDRICTMIINYEMIDWPIRL